MSLAIDKGCFRRELRKAPSSEERVCAGCVRVAAGLHLCFLPLLLGLAPLTLQQTYRSMYANLKDKTLWGEGGDYTKPNRAWSREIGNGEIAFHFSYCSQYL